jgi:hypothetical protein
MAGTGNLVFPGDKRRFAGDIDQMITRIGLMRRQEALYYRTARLDCLFQVLVRLHLLTYMDCRTHHAIQQDRPAGEGVSAKPLTWIRGERAPHLGSPPRLYVYKQPITISSISSTHHYSGYLSSDLRNSTTSHPHYSPCTTPPVDNRYSPWI